MDLTHSTTIESSPSMVFEVISTLGGLRSWWTNAIQGNPERKGCLRVDLAPEQYMVFVISELKNNSHLTLQVTEAALPASDTWIGTSVTLKVSAGGDRTTEIQCIHKGWQDESLSYSHWESRLASLKKLCETGKGDPEIYTARRT